MPVESKQRRFPRYPILVPMLHRPKTPTQNGAGVGWTRNLSEGGICAELAQRLQPSVPLLVRLRTDVGAIESEAQVVWAGEAKSGNRRVLHGIAFGQTNPAQQLALRDLVHRKGELAQVAVRVPVRLSVLCQRPGKDRPPIQGWTGNASRGGVLLHLPEVVSPNTPMELRLESPTGPLHLLGVIVWVDPPEQWKAGRPIRHGLFFADLGWSSLLALGRLLAELT